MRRALLVMLSLSSPAWALGLLEANPPPVQRGLDAFQKGDYEDALKSFDEAKKDLPNSAALEFDRGNALYKLGRFDEAKEAYGHVAELDQGTLRPGDYYNLGNAWARMGKNKEAIAAYRRALTLNPSDADARHNLEVLLRKLPPPQKDTPDGGQDGGSDAGQDGGRPDAGGQDGGSDGGQDGGQDGGRDGGADAGGSDGGMDGGADGGRGDGGSGKGNEKPGDGGEPQPNEQGDGGMDGGESEDGGMAESEEATPDGGSTEARLSREQAEKLLDSMKRDEKNLQLWRFQKKPRKPTDKDW